MAVFLVFGAAPGLATSFDLDKVMKGKVSGLQSEVRGAGGFYGDCIRVTIANETGQPVTVDVPLGLLLVPRDNPRVQTMVCAGGESLEAPPGTSVHRIKAFCGEHSDRAPGTGDVFSPGGRASSDLLKRVKEILKSQRFDRSTQDRIWEITNSLDLSKGAGAPSPAEKKATAAAVLTMLIFIAWQLVNNFVNVPGVPVPVTEGGGEAPPPGGEDEPESYDDRPAWSLVHRKENDIFDDKNERWVSRDSEEGKAILEAKKKLMEEKGFDYDAQQDAFIERGLVYDKYTDSFRKPHDKTAPADIKREEGDASKMYIGPGWLIPGDPGTSSDPEVVNKNLENRLKYLEELEDDAKSEHEALSDRLKKVEEQKDKDPWLEDQLRQRREDLKQKMRDVQEQKLDLTRRVDERDREYNTWAERQKKSWTAKKVAKELSEVFIPNPEGLKPLFERTLELRNKLQKAINEQPALFNEVDATVARLKQIAADMKAARDKGNLGTLESLQGEMAAARAKLQGLNNEMQMIHKKSAQWQAGSHVLTATAGMTASQYIGQGRMIYEVGKSGAQFLKPQPGFRRSAPFESTKGGRADREVYAVDKNGNIREIKGADAADYRPQKGEVVVSRDPYSGKLTEQEFGGGGRGQPLTDGQKNLLRQQAEKGLAAKPVRPLETGRKYAGPSGVTTAEDGSITYAPAEERTGTPEARKPVDMPKDLRELKDMVDKEQIAKMVKDKPGVGEQKSAQAEKVADRLIRGERPSYSRKDVPFSEKEWLERDKALHPGHSNKMKKMGEILGIYPDERAKEMASRNPDFARIDKAIRKAFDESGVVADDVLNPEPGERFMELATKKGVRPQDWKNWQKAMDEGEWRPIPENRPPTFKVDAPVKAGADQVGPRSAPEGKVFGKTMAGEVKAEAPSAPAATPDETPMASYEPPKSAVPPEFAQPRAAAQPQAPAQPHAAPQAQAPTPAPSGAPRPAAAPQVSQPPEKPAPSAAAGIHEPSATFQEPHITASAAAPPGEVQEASLSAGDRSFGARAATLEPAAAPMEIKLEGAGDLQRASDLKDLSSSLSAREISTAGALETAGLEKEIPLHEKSLSFARMLQGFLRKPK
jgi:hypothetical protein